ncbi:hypothetical protein C8J57DRAFT_1276385 [Mycena rebaudengoi]|nr:hypothetical protein C8J57DRAFT_1276385 [Mycena rebaudengoi]
MDNLTSASSAHNRYPGSFFANARDFHITGGTFQNNITHIHGADAVDPDYPNFRKIRLGDIYLRDTIQVVKRRQPSGQYATVRRVYSAQIEGREKGVTVAIYQGDNAAKDWKEAIAPYQSLRHPNVVQLFGISIAPGLYATVFHDGKSLILQRKLHLMKNHRAGAFAVHP